MSDLKGSSLAYTVSREKQFGGMCRVQTVGILVIAYIYCPRKKRLRYLYVNTGILSAFKNSLEELSG